MKFHEHIREVVRKERGLASELLRSNVCRSSVFMVSLFVSYIMPIMNYCSSIRNVGYLGDVRLLESVQRIRTREIFGIGHFSYVEKLKKLSLYSVYGRCVPADLIVLESISL